MRKGAIAIAAALSAICRLSRAISACSSRVVGTSGCVSACLFGCLSPCGTRLVELSFAKHPSREEREALAKIETSFKLSDAKVDRLIDAGAKLVRESAELHEALAVFDRP